MKNPSLTESNLLKIYHCRTDKNIIVVCSFLAISDFPGLFAARNSFLCIKCLRIVNDLVVLQALLFCIIYWISLSFAFLLYIFIVTWNHRKKLKTSLFFSSYVKDKVLFITNFHIVSMYFFKFKKVLLWFLVSKMSLQQLS